jgi:hypothetical protein
MKHTYDVKTLVRKAVENGAVVLLVQQLQVFDRDWSGWVSNNDEPLSQRTLYAALEAGDLLGLCSERKSGLAAPPVEEPQAREVVL